MLFTWQYIKEDEALRIGLVNAFYPRNELINEAKKLALNITKNSKLAVKSCIISINEGLQVDIDNGIIIERKLCVICFESPYRKERMKKFLERGKNWQKKYKY